MSREAENAKTKRRNCRTKATFKSKRKAAWRADVLRTETGMFWRYYPCEFKKHYHLTTKQLSDLHS